MAAVEQPIGRYGAFSYPQYRRYWVSMVARVFGLTFRFIGIPVFVQFDLELSPAWLGIASISAAVPTIVLSVPAGVLADRYDHQKILLISQIGVAALSFLLAFGIMADAVNIWHVIAWQISVGALSALSTPAQAAILPRLIDMRVMPSAIAFQSSIWNTMRIIGGAIGGVMLAVMGTGQAFLVTALGFTLSAFLIASLRPKPQAAAAQGADGGMFEGIRYILGNQLFLAVIGLSFFTSVFGQSYVTLLPIFADEILDIGKAGFGFLEAAAGLGGFIGTLTIIRIGGGRRAGPTMLVAAAVFGGLIAAFSGLYQIFDGRVLVALGMGLLFGASFFASMYLNLGMTVLQLRVPDELRGRVMGVWSMTWFLASVGAVPAALMAEWLGAPAAMAIGALSVTAFAIFVFVSAPELRGLRTTRTAAEGAAAGGD